MSRVDLSVVATFHREGMIARATLRSIALCRERAHQSGLTTELLAVLDRPDEATRAEVHAHCGDASARILTVDVGDLGLARNAAFAAARGAWGCTVDGDDLLSPSWMAVAMARAAAGQGVCVVHPEYVVEFGEGRGITRLKPMNPGSSDGVALLVTHPWTSVSLAPMAAYREVPYVGSTAGASGFGYEDWHWNLEQLALGRSHVVAHGTALLYRKRPDSMLARQVADWRVLAPGRFFSAESFLPIAAAAEASSSTSPVPQPRPGWWARIWPLGQREHASAAAAPPAHAIPFWLVNELMPLSAIEPGLDTTAEGLAERCYWEPQMRLGPGLRYAKALRSLRQPATADQITVCSSDAAVASAVRAGRGPVLHCSADAVRSEGNQSLVTIVREETDGNSWRDADVVLARLLLQLGPREVHYEESPRLRPFFDRYSRALRSAGIEPRPVAAASTPPISRALIAGNIAGVHGDHGTT